MRRAYYDNSITNFLNTSPEEIIGKIALKNEFSLEQTQKDAWLAEIIILKEVLPPYKGSIYFEYSIPRMGQRIDVIILIGAVIFILEFKIGEKEYSSNAIDQVMDYALDLKNFHESSHEQFIAPILIATKAKSNPVILRIIKWAWRKYIENNSQVSLSSASMMRRNISGANMTRSVTGWLVPLATSGLLRTNRTDDRFGSSP